MIFALFLKGLLIGFSIAMPVGPIGLLCMRNSMTYGMRVGLLSGIGDASADAFYAILGGLGLFALLSLFSHYQMLFQLVGALFLGYLGTSIFLKSAKESDVSVAKGNPSKAFFSTFLLTLANPLTIMSFAGVYAGLGISGPSNLLFLLVITVGVFLGSALWWLFLSFGASYFRKRLSLNFHKWLNRISGAVIFGFGIVALLLAMDGF